MNIKTYKQQMETTRKEVQRLLQWGEDYHNNFYLDQAKKFLILFLGDEAIAEEMYEATMFWQWWKNQWHQRDVVFVSFAAEFSYTRRNELYAYLHSPQYLNCRPQRPVMESLLDELTRSLQKKAQSQNAAVYAAQGIINHSIKTAV